MPLDESMLICQPTSYVLPDLLQAFLETFVVVFVAAYIADVSEPRASGDIPVVSVVLTPACVLAFEVDIAGRPRFFVLPKICFFANPASSGEVGHKESFDSSTGVRTNCGFCSNLSNVDRRKNRNLEHRRSSPSPGHNNVSGTSGLPRNATRNHSRNRGLHRYQGQRTRQASQAAPLPLELQEIR